MGITKLMHMKESKKYAHEYLQNTINYILNEKKTADGLWVGGNAGWDRQQILESFLETKKIFGKTDGRQGYHFIISFAKGEADEATAFNVIQDFCDEFLGNDYDYVFAIHNDKEHMHGHIVFNSVSIKGSKYHYSDGDWFKHIQPVTDKYCKKYGLPPLKPDRGKKGKSYAEWKAASENKIVWRDIIRADVDHAIHRSVSMDDFFDTLKKMGYQLKTGYSPKRKERYFKLKPPGKSHFVTNYNLAKTGYGCKEIMMRIRLKTGERFDDALTKKMVRQAAQYLKPADVKRQKSFRRLFQTVNYYKLPNPFAVPAYSVRKDMLQLEKLIETCGYLKRNDLKSYNELKEKEKKVGQSIRMLTQERSALYGINNMKKNMTAHEKELFDRYKDLCARLEKTMDDKAWEAADDELQHLRAQMPEGLFESAQKITLLSMQLRQLKRELGIIRRAAADEKDDVIIMKEKNNIKDKKTEGPRL